MTTNDLMQNCNRLEQQIQGAVSQVQSIEDKILAARSEIDRLNTGIIAFRLEFGNITDPQKIAERESTIREMDTAIRSREVEKDLLEGNLQTTNSELQRLQSAFNSLGCANIQASGVPPQT